MKRIAGFTLIEVLIAMAITALVATLAFSSLSSVLSGVEGLREQGERITSLNRARTILSRDISQFVPRPVRDEFGEIEAALIGGGSEEQSLMFTRIGWHNPNQQLRSHMQRLRYYLEDETLWRESYAVLDRTSDTEPARVALIENVSVFEIRFLGSAIELRDNDFDTDPKLRFSA